MKSLRDFLLLSEALSTTGRAKAARNSIVEIIADKDVWLPINRKIAARMGAPERVIAFHTANVGGFEGMLKIQGTAKAVSCFTQRDEAKLTSGIEAPGGLVLKLEGSPILAAHNDAYSILDDEGNRWIVGDHAWEDDETSLMKAEALRERLVDKYRPQFAPLAKEAPKSATLSKFDWDTSEDWTKFVHSALLVSRFVPAGKKIFGAFIKEYLDGLHAILERLQQETGSILQQDALPVRIRKSPTEASISHRFNEIILTYVKVLAVGYNNTGPRALGSSDIEDINALGKKHGIPVYILPNKEFIK